MKAQTGVARFDGERIAKRSRGAFWPTISFLRLEGRQALADNHFWNAFKLFIAAASHQFAIR
jgi:hypothetical protein